MLVLYEDAPTQCLGNCLNFLEEGKCRSPPPPPPPPAPPVRDFLYRRMVSEARGDLFVKATCLENSDQSLTLFLTVRNKVLCT